jgi:hypothetical protein
MEFVLVCHAWFVLIVFSLNKWFITAISEYHNSEGGSIAKNMFEKHV